MKTKPISFQVGKNIKQLRELKNFTQDYMAKNLGMTTSGYSKIERGEVNVTVEKLQQISSLLDMEINELLTFDDNMIFNNYGHAEGQSFSNHIGIDIQSIINNYESQLTFLRNEIEFLRGVIKSSQDL